MLESITLRSVANQLLAQGLLSPNTVAKITREFPKTVATVPSPPWFISALLGIGAWLAVIPFLGFLFSIHLVESPPSAIIVGAILVISTIVLHQPNRQAWFFNQLCLALNLTGQILCIGGTFWGSDITTAMLLAMALATLLIGVYQNDLHRFLSVLTAAGAMLVLLYDLEVYEGIHALIFGIAAGATWCWLEEANHLTDKTMAALYRPLGYGFVMALQIILLWSILPSINFLATINWEGSTLGLTLLLLIIEYSILYSHQVTVLSLKGHLIFTGTLLIGLLFSNNPGMLAALIVMLLGFQRGNRVLIGLSIVFLTIFLVAYYYYLEITLLEKSLALIGSGVVLLGLRFLLKRVLEELVTDNQPQ